MRRAVVTSVIAWDLETIPDLTGVARANGLDGKTDDELREAIGDKFPQAHIPLDHLHRSSRRK